MLSHQVGVEDHSVVNNLWGAILGVLLVLLGVYFSHGIDLSSKLFVVIGDLDYKGSVLIENVNALVDLSEGPTVDKSGDCESLLEG